MPHKSCTRITTKIRQSGYAKKPARNLSGSFQDKTVQIAGTTRVSTVLVCVHNTKINTYTTNPAQTGIHYALFGIHRQTPVC